MHVPSRNGRRSQSRLSVHRAEIKPPFALPIQTEFVEVAEPVSKMGFQFVEKGSAFAEAFEPAIAFHAEVKGIPGEAESLSKAMVR